jgi:tryptophan-rich sensory protein
MPADAETSRAEATRTHAPHAPDGGDRRPRAGRWFPLFLVGSFAAALPGAIWPVNGWYFGLAKPAWNPPNWLYGPVWTVLYVLIAIAAWRAWRARAPMTPWLVQWTLNAAWTGIFFGAHAMGLAFAEICLLWLAIAWTILATMRIDRPAAAMMVPYLAWVSFAGALNFAVWRLN